jgi:hypothetical protein
VASSRGFFKRNPLRFHLDTKKESGVSPDWVKGKPLRLERRVIKMFCDLKRFWERTRCDCCGEWIEPGFGERVWGDNEVYHWDCYWRKVWPKKAIASGKAEAKQ